MESVVSLPCLFHGWLVGWLFGGIWDIFLSVIWPGLLLLFSLGDCDFALALLDDALWVPFLVLRGRVGGVGGTFQSAWLVGPFASKCQDLQCRGFPCLPSWLACLLVCLLSGRVLAFGLLFSLACFSLQQMGSEKGHCALRCPVPRKIARKLAFFAAHWDDMHF